MVIFKFEGVQRNCGKETVVVISINENVTWKQRQY